MKTRSDSKKAERSTTTPQKTNKGNNFSVWPSTSLSFLKTSTVSGIIKTLKNNKAYDGTGISAEHFKYDGRSESFFITEVLNSVFRYGKVPEMFKMGYIVVSFNFEDSISSMTSFVVI